MIAVGLRLRNQPFVTVDRLNREPAVRIGFAWTLMQSHPVLSIGRSCGLAL